MGWNGNEQTYGPIVHADIIGGKVWIHHDDSKEGLATELVKAGVPKDRIVLAFWPQEVREYGEYAAA